MFQALRWRLLSFYTGIMVAIIGTSTIAVYQFVAYNLHEQIDRELITLADAARHNLEPIKKDPNAINRKLKINFDNDGDLDIPWQDLRESNQSIEWFDADGKLIGKAGKQFSVLPFTKSFQIVQQGQLRTLTIPVYPSKVDQRNKQRLQGYVRVSESIDRLSAELNRLLRGLSLGGVISLILTVLGGLWLTRQSLMPIEQSFQRLKQFTADASHELRSPLTVIKTSVEVMQDYPDTVPANTKKLALIASATNQMTRLVEDLLLLARTDAASPTPASEWLSIPLDELLEDLVDLLQQQAEAKEITLRLDASDEVFVEGDAAQLKRLFSNLLENALQYTPIKGNVNVSIDKQERFVFVRVQDTGIGIAKEHLKLVFQRFWRADQARSRRDGGSGLGLAIAQAIAQRHGGEITISSEVGFGSCFYVRLPIDNSYFRHI
ncbi:GHKL domain-containing protein [Brasilonema sp. CT11]|nr:GHKL domain-containing protein [Brasilonema sp. CT11]